MERPTHHAPQRARQMTTRRLGSRASTRNLCCTGYTTTRCYGSLPHSWLVKGQSGTYGGYENSGTRTRTINGSA
eukprot:1303733-Lingulodinium_polyedra.AAC.1